MATTIMKLVFITLLISLLMKTQILVHGTQQVPCFFIFGDSQSDNGNNNGIRTAAKVNYPPYGIDFPGGPTGRFSNGKNYVDFLAQLLGFQHSIPPFATTNGTDILQGLNYASGGSGILDESGAELGDRVSMSRQLLNHNVTIDRIAGLLRNRTDEYLQRCLYVVNMGSNDYINNYYLPGSPSRQSNTPQQFADILIIRKFSQQLRTLYDAGSRKIAVFGIGLLGCVPQYSTKKPLCVKFINDDVQLFNNALFSLINDLNSNLSGARFTYINATSILSGDPSSSGIKFVTSACCEVDRTLGLCIRGRIPCSNRSEYFYYDNFHVTEVVNGNIASRAYTALLPSDASPVDIRTLLLQ